MQLTLLHRWPRTVRSAIALQTKLAPRVVERPLDEMPRLVAGLDCAFARDGRSVIAGIVVWESPCDRVVETRVARAPCRFPYVPGLLSFRELPAVLRAFRMLRTVPDVVLCDAQGRAHPRRLGLASHLGLWLPMPTVGCAKSRLCGEHEEPPAAHGAIAPLFHRGEQVGVVLRTRAGVKPVYVSVGNNIDLPSAIRVVLSATMRYRLPEPARLAHQLVTRERTHSSVTNFPRPAPQRR